MPRINSRVKPIRAHLGSMSRLLRFAEIMDRQQRAEQAEGMRKSAGEHLRAARAAYAALPANLQGLLSDEERATLETGQPLPHSKHNRIITQYVDRETVSYQPDPEQAARLEEAEQSRDVCQSELDECTGTVRRVQDELGQLQVDLRNVTEGRKDCEAQLRAKDVLSAQQVADLRDQVRQYRALEEELKAQVRLHERYVDQYGPDAVSEQEQRVKRARTESQRRQDDMRAAERAYELQVQDLSLRLEEEQAQRERERNELERAKQQTSVANRVLLRVMNQFIPDAEEQVEYFMRLQSEMEAGL